MARPSPFNIAGLRFDPARCVVVGPDGEERLEPKLMGVALCLSRRAGEVVTREALIGEVWNGYPGADQSLSNSVSRLRQLLRSQGSAADAIETVTGTGYRLDPQVVSVATGTRIAVLPFRSIGGDREDEYLCEGLAEEVLNALAGVSSLHVAARPATFALAGSGRPLAEIASRLAVEYFVEGTVQRVSDSLRVRVSLIEANSETQQWSRRFAFAWQDILSIQEAVARAVISALATSLELPVPSDTVASPPPVDADRYGSFLRAGVLWYHDNLNPGAARAHYRDLIDRVPDFAAPYAGAVDCLCTYAYWQLMDQQEARVQGLSLAARGLSLADSSADAHFSHGYAQFYLAWDWDTARTALEKALTIAPNHLQATSFLCILAAAQGRDTAAEALARKLLQLDPVSGWSHFVASGVLAWLRDHAAAARVALEGLSLSHQPVPCLWTGSFSLARLGRLEEGRVLACRLQEAAEGREFPLALAVAAHALCGARGRAERLMEQLARRRAGSLNPIALLFACSGLGDKTGALRALEAAFRERNAALFSAVREPLFDPLREDERFLRVLREMGLEDGAMAAQRVDARQE